MANQIKNANNTIETLSKEITDLKLKLLKANSEQPENKENNKENNNNEELEKKINEQKTKIESLMKSFFFF